MIEPTFRLELGDALDLLEQENSDSVDLIFVDPPYNLQLPDEELYRPDESLVNGVRDAWDSFDDLSAYFDFTNRWLAGCKRVLKSTGSLFVMGTYHCIYAIGFAMMRQNWWIRNDIVWIKNNPMPQFRGVRLCNAHETLIWATKDKKSKYTFNYHALKTINGGKQLRSDWYFPICGGNTKERLKNAEGKSLHSTQKPEVLTNLIMEGWTDVGYTVLDPFCGVATSGVSALKYGCNYIGFDNNPVYIAASAMRLNKKVVEIKGEHNEVEES